MPQLGVLGWLMAIMMLVTIIALIFGPKEDPNLTEEMKEARRKLVLKNEQELKQKAEEDKSS
jgi:Sec-independent protein translocase protein TatA